MISWLFIGLVATILLTPPWPNKYFTCIIRSTSRPQKSAKLIPAEVLGYVISISAWGMLIGKVSATLPLLPPLKIAQCLLYYFFSN